MDKKTPLQFLILKLSGNDAPFFFPFAKQWISEDIPSYGSQSKRAKIAIHWLVNTNINCSGQASFPPLGGVYMRRLAPARVSHWDDFLIPCRVYMMTESFHIFLFNGTFHVDKTHVWFKIANITHALPVPVYPQTDFTPKWVVVSRLHETIARYRTGVKFSPRCENRGELTPGWLMPA